MMNNAHIQQDDLERSIQMFSDVWCLDSISETRIDGGGMWKRTNVMIMDDECDGCDDNRYAWS
jgi:hypothetical protein